MQDKNIKNPLPNVWKWIIINIVCQFSRFLRSFIYIIDPQNCQFTSDYTTNQILNLLFQLFGFHVGMISTVYFFRKKSNNEQLSSKQFTVSIRDRLGSGYSKEIQMQSTIKNSINGNNNVINKNYNKTILLAEGDKNNAMLGGNVHEKYYQGHHNPNHNNPNHNNHNHNHNHNHDHYHNHNNHNHDHQDIDINNQQYINNIRMFLDQANSQRETFLNQNKRK